MSGGSYDHLWASFPEQLSARLEDIQRMEGRLEALGRKRAAVDTRKVVQSLQDASSLATKDLREVWRCVEWLDSSDYSVGQVAASAREYEREAVRSAVGSALAKVEHLSTDPHFGQLVDMVSEAACEAAGLPTIRDSAPQ
jgi:hypothetical protein